MIVLSHFGYFVKYNHNIATATLTQTSQLEKRSLYQFSEKKALFRFIQTFKARSVEHVMGKYIK